MTRRLICVLLLLVLVGSAATPAGEEQVCTQCGAPLDPGALFCTQCGTRVEVAGEEGPAAVQREGPRASVVQVIAAHDKEMTSAFTAIAYGQNIEVPSILGSAFAVGEGEFVTDAGLLMGAKEIALRAPGRRATPARVVGIDRMIGIGLLAADLPGVPPLQQRTGGLPRVGESLTAIGFPSARRASTELAGSQGVVSGLHRTGLRIHPIEDYIQTDASLPDGFAGGPMVDAEGRVIGMSTAWMIGSTQVLGPRVGIGVAIPLPWVSQGLDWIRAGSPARPWMGIHLVPASDEERAANRLPPEVHWIVNVVFPGSPAEEAGLKKGEGILRIQGKDPETLSKTHKRLLAARPGDTWVLDMARGKEIRSANLTLSPRPERPRIKGIDALQFYGGLEVAAKGRSVLTVTRVLPRSEAAQAGVVPGDVLRSMLVKKDLRRAERRTARWRAVRNLADLERWVANGYSDLDFFIGLRFRCRDGETRRLYLREFLSPTGAL